ncbi:hypothetical protein ARMSODRAFT_661758 [Armillaria solidipes]|uniref:Uncharacterized protein n=1 Tax=Armillaria solidipes TaxID=1076256 RepID=A0A2H3B380_9AGAR|nr:hypothetical protein ARMSODRAFT_661758 [Armillaria solidipes]
MIAFPPHASYHQLSLVSTPVLLLDVHIFFKSTRWRMHINSLSHTQRGFLNAGNDYAYLTPRCKPGLLFPVRQIPRSGVNYVLRQFDNQSLANSN